MTPLGVLDLSIVTDALIQILTGCVDTKFAVSGKPPDAIRTGSYQLSLYLFHVALDRFQRNSPVVSQRAPLPPPGRDINRAQTIPAQPLSLDLYYLLSAYAGDDYVSEQLAMTQALKCFHEHPLVRVSVTIGSDTAQEQFTLTMEPETADDQGRLWQAITQSLRLSVVYKVSVVFITGQPAPRSAAQVQVFRAVANPAAPTTDEHGAATVQVMGTFRSYRYTGPNDTAPLQQTFDYSPATAGPGENLLLLGAALDEPTAPHVFLLAAGAEYDITAWAAPPVQPRTASKITLRLPATTGPLPVGGSALAVTPPAGAYRLRVGAGTKPGDPNYSRSNATALDIAASVDPTPPVILPPDGSGVFTIRGVGFIAGQTELFLETIALASGSGSAGGFAVTSPSAIQFMPPTNLPAGTYAVRIWINGIECAPTKWIRT